MTTAEPLAPDRRQRRRSETVEEILDVAVTVMSEHGAAGLTLGEVARRMGIRPPSLYGYFDSKNALYDALFRRGWSSIATALAPVRDGLDRAEDLPAFVLGAARAFVRWAIENPAYAQLMFWRPVPGFEPSPASYEAALASMRDARDLFSALRDRGTIRADVDVDEAVTTWTVLITGVITQQLANAPTESFDQGTFSRLLPQLVSMHLARYGPGGGNDDSGDDAAAGARPAADGAPRSPGRDERPARGADVTAARARRR
jgi:AcrR family transcriptional regulator